MATSKVNIYKLDDPNTYFEVKINPDSLTLNRHISYTKDQVLGSSANVNRFDSHGPSTLKFSFTLDSTGIAYDKKETIQETIQKMEKVMYKMNSENHQPDPVKVNWGDFSFNCRLSSLNYDYSLFAPSGEPLRVKVMVDFVNYTTREEEVKAGGKTSPDMSHIIILKSGESIAFWCNKIYGEAFYCKEVAEHNGLKSFRNVKPGTQLMFPPLVRNG